MSTRTEDVQVGEHGLTAAAVAVLAQHGLSPEQWIAAEGYEGKWTGDVCGCPDSRCANGFHHQGVDDCTCLPVWIEEYYRNLTEKEAPAVAADEKPTEADHLAYMAEVHALEASGVRHSIEVGPFTALITIGALQLATRHPQLDPDQRRLVLGVIEQFRPRFAGTLGEHIIDLGNDPSFDRAFGDDGGR